MTNNEQVFEENTDTSSEDEKDESQEETKDWKAEALKYKAIAERKGKKLQKSVDEKTDITNKSNTEQSGLTMDDMMLVQKGLQEDEIKFVKESARVLNIPVMEAFNNSIVQSKINSDRQEATIKSNTLPPSGGSASSPKVKTPGEMTEMEHAEWGAALIKNAVNK